MNNSHVDHPERYRICSDCWICDEDLALAMQKMTDANIEFIIEKANIILGERKTK